MWGGKYYFSPFIIIMKDSFFPRKAKFMKLYNEMSEKILFNYFI